MLWISGENAYGRSEKRMRRYNGRIGEYSSHSGSGRTQVHAGQAGYQNTSTHTMEIVTDERNSRSPQRRVSSSRRHKRPREGYSSKRRRRSTDGRSSSQDMEPNARRAHRKGSNKRRSEAARFQLGSLPTTPRPCVSRRQSDLPSRDSATHIQHELPDPDRLQVPSLGHGQSRPRKFSRRKSPSSQGSSSEVSYPDRIYDPRRNQPNTSMPQPPQHSSKNENEDGDGRVRLYKQTSSSLDRARPIDYPPSLLPMHIMAKKNSFGGTSTISTPNTTSSTTTSGVSVVDSQRVMSTETALHIGRRLAEPSIELEHPGSLVDFSQGSRGPSPPEADTIIDMSAWEGWASVEIASPTSEPDINNRNSSLVSNISVAKSSSKGVWGPGSNSHGTCTTASSSYTTLGSCGSSSELDSSSLTQVGAVTNSPSLPDPPDFHNTWSIATPSPSFRKYTGAPPSESTSSTKTIVYAPLKVIDSHSCTPPTSESYVSRIYATPPLDTQVGLQAVPLSAPGQLSPGQASYLSTTSPTNHQSSNESLSTGYATPVYSPAPKSLPSSGPGRSRELFTPPSLDYLIISTSPPPPEVSQSEATALTRSRSPSQYSEETVRGSPILSSSPESDCGDINTSDIFHEPSLVPSEPVPTTNWRHLAPAPTLISYNIAPELTPHSHTPGYTTPWISTFSQSESRGSSSRVTPRAPPRGTREDRNRYVLVPQITITRESRTIAIPRKATAKRGDPGVLWRRETKEKVEKVATDDRDERLTLLGGEGALVSIVSPAISRYRATVESVVDDSDDTGDVVV